MIGKLSGIIDSFAENYVILDVSGVGYIVYASRRTLTSIGQPGDAASLLINTHVREDAFNLYGFADVGEQAWYRLLTSVQGVGAKAALAILSVSTPQTLSIAIAAQDKAAFTQADGVGPKIATRILTELKDKAAKMDMGAALAAETKSTDSAQQGSVSSAAAQDPQKKLQDTGAAQDAISALVNLGYARSEAYTAVMNARGKSNDNLQDLIREALKELSV